ncbi:MAG: hypothetical protein J6U92_01825 [Clostridia bacterium]|nr:hypothetical protein [Clostridia bacterium]
MKKLLTLLLSVFLLFSCGVVLSACGGGNNCSHNFTSEWFTDATHHWQQCSICGEQGLKAEHDYVQENAINEYLKTSATTTSKATYYKSCVCGVKGEDTFESGKILGEVKNLAMSSTEIIYGDNYSVNCDNDENVTIEYKYSWDIDEGYSAEKPTRAGTYVARVTTAETETHTSVVETISFEIKPKKLQNVHKELVYNSFEYREVLLDDIESGLFIRLQFASKNAGADLISAEIRQIVGENGLEDVCSNYELVLEGQNACTFEVVQKEIEVNWIAPWSLAFKNDGYDFEPSVQFNGLEINDWCEGVIELNSGDNYWYDSTFTFKIIGLTGDDANNYKLPTQNLISPQYTITCDGETSVHQQISLQGIKGNDNGGVDSQNTHIIKFHLENGGEFKFKQILQTQGAVYSIRILKKGIKGDDGFVRSVQIVTGHEATGEYSETFTLQAGDYYLEIVKFDTETISGTDIVSIYYSYES